MVQPNYTPKEALERVKLMMSYDTSKTLNENKQIIEEQPSPGALAATTAGALTGAGLAGAGGAIAAGASLLTLPILLPAAATAAAAYGVYKLVDWISNGDRGKDGFAQVMSVCKSPGVSKLVPKMSKSEIRNLAYQIEDAKGDWNDDEEGIVSTLEKIESIADLCAVDNKISGGLFKFLDDLTDSPEEWKMFTRPLAGMIEDTEIALTPEEQKRAGDGKKTGKGGGYKPCSGKYVYGCMSEVIKQVQGCLSLVQDGKYGKKTKAALASVGFPNGFTDADVEKICKTSNPQKKEVNPWDESPDTIDSKVNNKNNPNTDNKLNNYTTPPVDSSLPGIPTGDNLKGF